MAEVTREQEQEIFDDVFVRHVCDIWRGKVRVPLKQEKAAFEVIQWAFGYTPRRPITDSISDVIGPS